MEAREEGDLVLRRGGRIAAGALVVPRRRGGRCI